MDEMLAEALKFGAGLAAQAIGLPPAVAKLLFRNGAPGLYAHDDGDLPNAQRTAALEEVKRKDGSVTLWIGTRETGKTTGARRQGEYYGRPTYAVSPEEKPPSWIKAVTLADLNKLPSRITLILDDLPAYMSNRDYNNQLVQTVEKIVPMCRHERKWHIIFNTQSTAQADKYILDCELAFFKPLGILMADAERPNIRRIYRDLIDPYFENRTEHFIRTHAFMKSRTFVGGMLINKPSEHGPANVAPAGPVPAAAKPKHAGPVLIAEKNAQGVYEVVGEDPDER